MKILQIIKKNYKLLIRSKSSALIVLLGPLVLMVLVSLAFNSSSLFNIRVGAYSEKYSDLSESLIQELQKNEFKVIKAESLESCTKGVETEQYHVCAVFPKDLSIKSTEAITFYVDKSKVNIVYIIMNSLSSKISIKSSELSTALTTTLVNTLNDANTKINEKQPLPGKVSSKLEESKSKISKISSGLESLDLSSSNPGNFTLIAVEIEKIRNETGSGSSTFSKLNSLINTAKESLESTNSKLSSVSSIRDSSAKELKSINEAISSNKEDLSSIESGLKDINSRINAIEIKDVQKIVNPLSTEIKSVSKESTHLSYTFPALILIVVMFSGIFIAAISIIDEKSSKAYFRNFITPTKDYLFLLGHYFFSLIVVLLQIVVIFIVMLLITKTPFSSIPWTAFILLLIISSIFILMGIFIGYLFKSGETANIAAISISTIMLFFSNTILPLETLPETIQKIASFNPFVLGESTLRRVLIFNEPLTDLTFQLSILLVYIVVFAALAYAMREISSRKL